MTKFDSFCNHINSFFAGLKSDFECRDILENLSKDDGSGPLIQDDPYKNIVGVSMDYITKRGYKIYKSATTKHLPNSVDAFFITKDNCWYFVEFKNAKISNSSDSVEKKAFCNLLMLMDLMKHSHIEGSIDFDNDDPINFIRNNCFFILVFSEEKDPLAHGRVRDKFKINEKYTPECLEKFKQFFFKDAYAYSVEYFQKAFLNNYLGGF